LPFILKQHRRTSDLQ